MAAASLGVGRYGRNPWLPLGYQILCLETHTSGKRIRREYSERHGRFDRASHESTERAEQILRFGSPRVSSHPRRDTHDFVPDFDALLKLPLEETHKRTGWEYRAKADGNQLVTADIIRLADELLRMLPLYHGEARTLFVAVAKHLMTRLLLAVPVSPSGALAAELVEPRGEIASAAVTTHLFVAILMAQGQDSHAVPLVHDKQKGVVYGEREVTSGMLAGCLTAGDGIEAFERVLWEKLLGLKADRYDPVCKIVPDGREAPPSSTRMNEPGHKEFVTFEQCLERRRSRDLKAKCNQDCHRWHLYDQLVDFRDARERPFVVLKQGDAQPWRSVAERVRDVSFICFGEGDDSSRDIEGPVSRAIHRLYRGLQGA